MSIDITKLTEEEWDRLEVAWLDEQIYLATGGDLWYNGWTPSEGGQNSLRNELNKIKILLSREGAEVCHGLSYRSACHHS